MMVQAEAIEHLERKSIKELLEMTAEEACADLFKDPEKKLELIEDEGPATGEISLDESEQTNPIWELPPDKLMIYLAQAPILEKEHPSRVSSAMGKLAKTFKSSTMKALVTGAVLMSVVFPIQNFVSSKNEDQEAQLIPTERIDDTQKIDSSQSISPDQMNIIVNSSSPDQLNQIRAEAQIAQDISTLENDITRPPAFNDKDLIRDDEYIRSGSELCWADMLRVIDKLTQENFTDGYPSKSQAKRYKNTVDLLTSAKKCWPEAVKFKIQRVGGKLTIRPVDWHENVEIKEAFYTSILVVGGELESITTAMRAADKGREVTLLYSGPLGGLSSDSGGNMRYFDGVESAPRTNVHDKLFRDGLGMSDDNLWSLPNGMSEKLLNYLRTNYPKIRLVETASYNSMHVKTSGKQNVINSVITDEGISISPVATIDTDPEARLAEKLGIPETIETPALGYGMVFDMKNVSFKDFEKMQVWGQIGPENIMRLAGVGEEVLTDRSVKAAYDELQKSKGKAGAASRKNYITWGYQAASRAYDLYMRCLEYKAIGQEKTDLKALNDQRRTSGFNVAHRTGEATLNSISYNAHKTILQGDHSLRSDPDFAQIRDIEIPHLQEFFRQITGNGQLEVVMPDQFYVRQATASFETVNPYNAGDFNGQNKPESDIWMTYGMDVRDRNEERHGSAAALGRMPYSGIVRWNAKPSASITSVPGYHIVSRSGVPGELMPSLRIIQSLMGQGVAVVDDVCSRFSNQDWQESEDYTTIDRPPNLQGEETRRRVNVSFTPKGNPIGVRTMQGGVIDIVLPS